MGFTRKKRGRALEKSSAVGPKTRQDEKKWTSRGKKTSAISRKIARKRTQNEERREKNGLHRAKNEGDSSKKCRRLSLKWGKARKTEISGRKRRGGGEAEKWALLLILQCYEVAKWVQMKFSRIFFRRSLAGNAEMPYLCTRNREATLLQERVTLESDEAAKALL